MKTWGKSSRVAIAPPRWSPVVDSSQSSFSSVKSIHGGGCTSKSLPESADVCCDEPSPSEGFSTIIGNDEAKAALEVNVVLPLTLGRGIFHGLRSCGHVLLFGPPGTGKTSLAKVLHIILH
jgi:ATP-dependent Zn protease